MALDEQLMREAKESFGKKFRPKIAKLGYNLAYGFSMVGGSFAITARVQSDNQLSKNLVQQIDDIIPRQYSYKGRKIPVEIIYTKIPRAY